MPNLPDAHKPVLFYEGPYFMFDNFSSFAVEIWERVCPTAEHAYQMAKFTDKATRELIFNARSAHDAKKVARTFDDRKRVNWSKLKLGVMEEILRAKLDQHEYIRKKLLETGDRLIVEDSPKDNFWGRGPDWKGANNLGKLWMKLRAELRAGTFVY